MKWIPGTLRLKKKKEIIICSFIISFQSLFLKPNILEICCWVVIFGKFMDPLADKLMLIAVLACFWFKGVIPLYIMLIILAKDAIMIIVGGILYSKHVVVYADWFGKIATGLFVGAITLTFMQLEFGICPFYLYAYFAAIAAALISFFHYGINTFIRNRKKK